MMTTDDKILLDQSFAELAAEDVPIAEGLMDRIMRDADTVLAGNVVVTVKTPQAVPEAQGFWAALLDAIGGWMAFGGLSASAMTGLWIGVFPPDVLYDYSSVAWGDMIEVPVFEDDVFAALEE